MTKRLLPALILIASASATAQQTSSVHATVPAAHATRAQGHVAIDGKIDEAAWAAAIPIREFRQSQPNEGQLSALATEVRFLFDDEANLAGEGSGRSGWPAWLAEMFAEPESEPADRAAWLSKFRWRQASEHRA